MTLQDLGNIGELIGAVGVVISLLYLAFQIRRSTQIARAESQRELMLTHDIHHPLVSQPDAIDVLRRGMHDFEKLTKDEQARFHHYFSPLIDRTDSVFRMHRLGLAEDQTWELWRRIVLSIIATSGGRRWWEIAGVTIGGADLHRELRAALSREADNVIPMNQLWPFYAQDE